MQIFTLKSPDFHPETNRKSGNNHPESIEKCQKNATYYSIVCRPPDAVINHENSPNSIWIEYSTRVFDRIQYGVSESVSTESIFDIRPEYSTESNMEYQNPFSSHSGITQNRSGSGAVHPPLFDSCIITSYRRLSTKDHDARAVDSPRRPHYNTGMEQHITIKQMARSLQQGGLTLGAVVLYNTDMLNATGNAMNEELQKLDETIYVIHNLDIDFPGRGYDAALVRLLGLRDTLTFRMNTARVAAARAEYAAQKGA